VTLVVKIGGAAGVDIDAACADIAELTQRGERVVVVNGGSCAGDTLLKSLGLERPEVRLVSGNIVRMTNAATLRILTMAWVGDVNKRIVEALLLRSVSAIGLCGADGRLLLARRRSPLKISKGTRTRIERDHVAGEIVSVNAQLLALLQEQGYVPVLCPPAVTADGCFVSVDADHAAAAVATSLGARALVFLSNVPGLLENPEDPSSVVQESHDVERCMRFATGRMRYKLEATRRALQGGTPAVHISSSRIPRPVFAALAGKAGTKFIAAKMSAVDA
jgi:acetylglutamate/LysW-gamma-L-alpha-aminoadipate kinase